MIADAFDRLIAEYCSGAAEPELVRAREEYFERTGRVFEDDEIYEARTVAFLEWYALDRAQGDPPETPCERFLRDLGERGPSDDAAQAKPQAAARALCSSHRGLFEVLELTDSEILLRDLAAGGRYRVNERRRLPGVGVGDVFEGRLVAYDGEILFLRTFLFHPRGAAPAIRQLATTARRQGDSPAEICERLARLRVRCERYRHVAPEKIYEGTLEPPETKADVKAEA